MFDIKKHYDSRIGKYTKCNLVYHITFSNRKSTADLEDKNKNSADTKTENNISHFNSLYVYETPNNIIIFII